MATGHPPYDTRGHGNTNRWHLLGKTGPEHLALMINEPQCAPICADRRMVTAGAPARLVPHSEAARKETTAIFQSLISTDELDDLFERSTHLDAGKVLRPSALVNGEDPTRQRVVPRVRGARPHHLL